MESQGADPKKTPASYADFSDAEEQGGWLKTAVQFFAIPMLIVILAVGVYLGVNLMLGGSPQTASDFVELLKSDTVTRRSQAAFELAMRLRDEVPEEFRSEAMVTSLCDALEKARADKQDPPTMAMRVLLILARIRQPDAIPAVRSALDDPHPWTRSYAILALGELKDKESEERIREFVTHEDPQTRQIALRALVSLEQQVGVPYHIAAPNRELLKKALGDRNEDVRFEAAAMLARVGEREAALPVLKTMLDREYLEKLVPTSEMDTSLSGLSRYDVHSNVLMAGLRAVRRLDCGDDPEVVTLVRKLTDSDSEGDPDVRARARELLVLWNEQQGA
jgi:HEAT repeat protein